jgi:hypothetical protein
VKFDGRVYRRNRYLGWRNSVTGDKYAGGGITKEEGQQIDVAYVVVFRIKDAPIITLLKNGHEKEYYKPDYVPSSKILPLAGHSLCSLALGTPKKKKGVPLRDVWLNCGKMAGQVVHTDQEYIEQPHYLVKDGVVYQWTSRRALDVDEQEAA